MAGLLTGNHFNEARMVEVMRQEFELMERALLDSCEDHNISLYQWLRRKLAAIKIQKTWRHRIKVW